MQALLANGGGSLGERMGIRITEATPERVVATMPVEGNTQPYGLLHGGASIALAGTPRHMRAIFTWPRSRDWVSSRRLRCPPR